MGTGPRGGTRTRLSKEVDQERPWAWSHVVAWELATGAEPRGGVRVYLSRETRLRSLL
jgi:hypothetical protein